MARTAPAPVAADHAAAARALIDRQLARLDRLAEIGMELAEIAGRRAAANTDTDTEPRHDPGLTYARVARAVRMTIALQSRLLADLAALDRAAGVERAAQAAARRRRIHHVIERAIEAEHDGDEIDALSSDVWERLTDDDDADLAERPFAEIVARICADLGLSPEETARALEAASGAAGPVFTALPTAYPPTADPTVVPLNLSG